MIATYSPIDAWLRIAIPWPLLSSCARVPSADTQAILQILAEASTQPQANSGFQNDLVFTVVLELKSTYAIEIHDNRSMNTAKLAGLQIPLKFRQGAAQ
jgi:hypothetical protein